MDDIQHIQNVDELLAYELTEQDDPTHELWAQLSVGMISTDEALQRARELNPQLDDEELQHRVAAFAPPPADVMATELAAILEQHEQRPETDIAPPIPLRPGRSTRLPRATAAAGLAAAAAALVLVLQTDDTDDTENERNQSADTVPSVAVLPAYDAEWQESKGTKLGAEPSSKNPRSETEPLVVSRELSVKLRPRTAIDSVKSSIRVKAWARDADGHEHVLRLSPEHGDRGVIQVRERVEALRLEPGMWTITLAIGLETQLESPADLGDDLVVLHKEVRVVQ